MKSSVILKKQYAKDDIGTLFIRYFNGKGTKKDKSLKIKMNESIFRKTFGKDFQRFKKTTLFDYNYLNSQIELYINDFSIFDDVKQNENAEILLYLKSKLRLIGNPATRHSYSNVISLFEKFLLGHKSVKEFKHLNMDLFIEFKNDLKSKGTEESSIMQYFVILKTMLNKASKNIDFKNPLIIKELGLKPIKKKKNILSNMDILKLINTSQSDKYFVEIQISLFQLFCDGARISDVFLMKIDNLKEDGILYVTKKNNTELFISYSPALVDVLFKYFNLQSELGSQVIYEDNEWIYTQSGLKYGKFVTKRFILLDYLKTADKNRLIFHDYISKKGKILLNYKKEKEMTDEQMRVFNNILGYHLQKLKFIIKTKGLDIENLTTHTMRYTFTNLLLTMDGVNLLDISKALGHANIRVTNDYLDKNFGGKRKADISFKLSESIYKLS